MDSVSRLTTRQRLRRLRFGLPKAIRLLCVAAAFLFLAGLGLGLSFNARAIGTVSGDITYETQRQIVASGDTRKCGSAAPSQTITAATTSAVAAAWASAKTGMDTYNCPYPGSAFASQWNVQTTYSVVSVDSAAGTFVYQKVYSQTDINQYCTSNCTSGSTITAPAGTSTVQIPTGNCPANSTKLSSGNCECNLNFRPDSFAGTPTSCVAYKCAVEPRANDRILEGLTSKPPIPEPGTQVAYYCDTYKSAYQTQADTHYGCGISESLYAANQGADGKWTARYVSAYNGKGCNDVGAADPNSPLVPNSADGGASAPGVDGSASSVPGTCPAGQCKGTVQGATVCAACSRTVGEIVTQSVDTNASGVTTGVTTTGTKADCAGDKCTVTTTTSINGAVTNTTTTVQDKESMCKASPQHPACGGGGGGSGNGEGEGEGGGGGFGGTCAGGFTCSGEFDAITCAIATEQHKRDCQFWGDDDGSSATRGAAAIIAGDTPGDHPGKVGNGTTQAVTFDTIDLLGSGCPSDLSVPMPGGHSVMLPISALCTPAAWLGNLLVGITALACLGIAFKGS